MWLEIEVRGKLRAVKRLHNKVQGVDWLRELDNLAKVQDVRLPWHEFLAR